MLEITTFVLGALRTNCYLIKDTKTGLGAIIDPGGASLRLDENINTMGKNKIKYIILTHGHFDHILKAKRYKDYTGAKIVIGENEAEFTENTELNLGRGLKPFKPDILLKDKEELLLGDLVIKALHTPGHTRGGMCYIVDNVMFCGDTIMKGCFGRTDFATGSSEDLENSIEKIKDLNSNYELYPGHGERTTLFDEIQ